MRLEKISLGIFFALLAALCNATIGIFSTFGMKLSISPDKIAFYRCVIALIATSVFLLVSKNFKRVTLKVFIQISICALFGIFVLYFFETLSYQHTTVANVTFLLMGASSIVTLIAGRLILNETMTLYKLAGTLVIFMGIFLMARPSAMHFNGAIGNGYAITAGCGYAVFLLLARKFMLGSSLLVLWYFFLAGSVYLSIPCLINNDFHIPDSGWLILVVLAIVPTLGGFYFTTKALSYIEAGRTQLFEMSEPIFASLLGLFVLHQAISVWQLVGGILIFSGLIITEKKLLFLSHAWSYISGWRKRVTI